VSAGLSFYAWKINRDWQKNNQKYLRELAALSSPASSAGAQAACPAVASPPVWTDASHRPVTSALNAA